MIPPEKVCYWREDEDGNYTTDCGEEFVIVNGTPAENGMRYCCYCGKVLAGVSFVANEKEEPPHA